MDLERVVETLSEELKFPAIPQKDKSGCYQLQINPATLLSIKGLDPGVFIHTQVLPMSKEKNQEALFIHLMKANLLGQGTGGAALGIDEKETFFTLSLSLSFEINYKVFHDALEDFLNYTDYWREEIPKLQTSLLS